MKATIRVKTLCAAVAAVFGTTAFTAHAASETVFSGEVTPNLTYFDYFKGAGTASTQFLERYNAQKGSDTRGGLYPDVDLSIVGKNAERETFRLERQGFGAYNHRGTVKADTNTLGFSGYYSSFRSTTGGLGFLYSPNQVPGGGTDSTYYFPAATNTNSGFVAQFNDDSGGQRLYKIDRTTYGLGLALKPQLLGMATSAAVNYDGYKRDGNRFASHVLGGSDVAGANAKALQRWRGFDMPVDERMNRVTLNLTGAPGGFVLSYDGSVEKFDNKAREFTVADFTPLMAGFGVASNKPLHFVPDSTLISNNFRFAKNYGSTAVAAGYGLSVLDQDSFSQRQQQFGYTTGKITTNSAFLNVNGNLSGGVGVEGFVKYNNRKNDSTFPAIGLISQAIDQQLGVRINRIKALNYGLAASFRAAPLKSTMTAGWKHEDKSRDLTWHDNVVGGGANGIAAQRSFYRADTKSDEIYLKVISRPMPGMMLRITPSYQWASETGQVSEPEKAVGLKAKVTYAMGQDRLLSGYYDYKSIKNANNAISGSAAASLVPIGTVTQDVNKKLQAAGISLSMKPSEWINTTASLSWNRDDFSTYFLRSDVRRFEAPATAINFLSVDRPNYDVDTYVFSLGGDWQVSDELRWNGGYTYSASKGDTSSGYVGSALTATAGSVDGRINSTVHSLALGVSYELKKNMKLKASYSYDYYDDKIYSALTGGVNGLMLGVSLGF
jgi:hypothetical protein